MTKRGRKPENGISRTRSHGTSGPWLRSDVANGLKLWREVHGIPFGRAVDALYDYANGKSDFRIEIKRWNQTKKSVSNEEINTNKSQEKNQEIPQKTVV